MRRIPVFIHGREATDQDVHEFIAAKQARGEKPNVDVNRGARATAVIVDRAQFSVLRRRLRESKNFGRASERIDALERELWGRRKLPLPLPERIEQEADGALGFVWRGLTVAADRDNILALRVPGAPPLIGIVPELVDALAALAVAGA